MCWRWEYNGLSLRAAGLIYAWLESERRQSESLSREVLSIELVEEGSILMGVRYLQTMSLILKLLEVLRYGMVLVMMSRSSFVNWSEKVL